MENVGSVSLWIGRFENKTLWQGVLQTQYTEDGDWAGSQFTRAFGIKFYDEDFQETKYFPDMCDNLEMLLAGSTSDSVLISNFSDQLGGRKIAAGNCVILLYNFAYSGTVKRFEFGAAELIFLGVTRYK
jgi:hypothetical protein